MITRKQQETRRVFAAGRVAWRLGIKKGHFNQAVCKGRKKKVLICEILSLCFQCIPTVVLSLRNTDLNSTAESQNLKLI